MRTRLQAQGTPSHPQTYTGIRDAAFKCYQLEGWRGFYKGELSGGAKDCEPQLIPFSPTTRPHPDARQGRPCCCHIL